jgi:hypothetical protein
LYLFTIVTAIAIWTWNLKLLRRIVFDGVTGALSFETEDWEVLPVQNQCHLLGYNIVQSVENQSTFRRNISSFSSEMLIESQRSASRHIPEDITPHNPCCENLKSYNILSIFLKINYSSKNKGTNEFSSII